MNTETTHTQLFTDLPLHERLQLAIENLGYKNCTDVQQRAIPLILEGKDLQVSAATGSGKTAAFLLPVIDKLLRTHQPNLSTRVLILAPTRELARQLAKQAQQLCKFNRIQTGLITGGDDFKYQKALFRKNPEIIIATPGRLLEHLVQKSPDFEHLEVLILDEADRMLDMGFEEDVVTIVEQCNVKRQTLLFSATLKSNAINRLSGQLLQRPETVIVNRMQEQHQSIRQQIVTADGNPHKQQIMNWLLSHEQYEKALIFTNTRDKADKLVGPLKGQKFKVAVLHGEIEQDERNRIMQLFRQGAISILVATDLAARGLDVDNIDLVINFDMARNATDYVHRIGRTGRAGKSGLAISLIKANEWNLMNGIERYLQQKFELRRIEAVAGQYNGPENQKKSGKAAGVKKKKSASSKKTAEKNKQRHRDKKNIGKRRKPSASGESEFNKNGGWGVLKRRSSQDSE